MKFWHHPSKNFTNPVGRYVWQDTSANPAPEESVETKPSAERSKVLSEVDRERARLDTEMALAQLQEQVENEQIKPRDLPLGDQVKLLIRIAQNDSISDSVEGSGDDRNYTEWIRDSVGGVVDNVISTEWAQYLQSSAEISSEGDIIRQLSSDAKHRFLLDYRHDAFNLFTDSTGDTDGGLSYRADFFGDTNLASQANFMNMLSNNDPAQKYIKMNNEYYVRTPYGYLGFSPNGVIGNRAKISSGTDFTTLGSETLPTEMNKTLVDLKEKNSIFSQIENSQEMSRLEANRSTNFYTAQTWKGFAETITSAEISSELPFAQNIQALFNEGAIFRQFLDADTVLSNYSSNSSGVAFSIPRFGESAPALSSTSNPGDFRDGITKALQVVQAFTKNEIQKYQASIDAEDDPKTKNKMISHLQTLSQTMPQIFESVDAFTVRNYEAYEAMKKANTELILIEFPDLKPDQLNKWVHKFDLALAKMAESGEFNLEDLQAQMGIVLAQILGVSDTEGQKQLADNPRLKELLLARVNTLSRHPGIRDMEAAIEIGRQQFYIQSTIEALNAVDPSLLDGINTQSPSVKDINKLKQVAARMQKSLEMRLRNDDPLSEKEVQLLTFLKTSGSILQRASVSISEAEVVRTEAQQAEITFNEVRTHAEEVLDPSTETGARFHETVDVSSQYIRRYREENNGEIPSFSTDKFQSIQTRLEAGETPAQISLSLDSDFQSAPPEQQEVLIASLNSLPPNTNFVGLTPEGQYIIEAPGSDKTRFIQDPGDGKIMAEKFKGIPDNEDVQTPNWPLAQVYAAVTGGNVTQGLTRITAQSAEHGGQASMGQYMTNLTNDLYRDPNYTFSPNQLKQWEQLGQRMAEYNLTLDQTFARLGGGYSIDGTLNTSQTPNGPQLITLLEASVAENREGFERILGLESERPRQVIAEENRDLA